MTKEEMLVIVKQRMKAGHNVGRYYTPERFALVEELYDLGFMGPNYMQCAMDVTHKNSLDSARMWLDQLIACATRARADVEIMATDNAAIRAVTKAPIDTRLRVIVQGAQGAGKTTLIERLRKLDLGPVDFEEVQT